VATSVKVIYQGAVLRLFEKSIFWIDGGIADFADIFQHLGCRPEWKPIPDSAISTTRKVCQRQNESARFKTQLFMIEKLAWLF